MIYKIIILYLVGIIIEVNFNPDIFCFYMSFIMSFIYVLYVFYNDVHKGHSITIKNLYKVSLFLILFFVFWLSIAYTKYEMRNVSYKGLENEMIEIVGKVMSMKHASSDTQAILKVINITNLQTNSHISDSPKYINISVSPYFKTDLYDQIDVIGELNYNNYQTYYENQPLFFSYQFEQPFFNSAYNVSQPKNISIISKNKNVWETLLLMLNNFSETVNDQLEAHMQQPYASVAEGISLGNQENILKDIKDIFKKSGLIHILVLSGANVSFIISIIWFFVRNTKNKFKVFCVTFISWIFIFITGLTPPSLRAGVMSTTNIFSEYFSKNISPIYSLLVSLFVLTILNPLTLVYSASLHLSFLACFGLFIVAPKMELFFKKKNFVNFFLSLNLGMFLTITPYILALTGYSSIFGTVLTIIVEPFVALTTIFSFSIIATSFINFYLAEFFGILNTLIVKIILSVANFGASNLPLINFQVSKTYLIIYYLILLFVFLKNDIIYKNFYESK